MPHFQHGDISLELDIHGFVVNGATWSEEAAAALAIQEGIPELTPDHWKVIHFLRAHHAQHGVVPMVRVLCKETGFTLKHIYDLFEKGPNQGACRIAGLPRPDSCV
jgi:tRNA 2-thiouridine synthesizing protein E